MKKDDVIKKLRSHASARNVEGMARFGINSEKTLGVPVPVLRKIAREVGRDHALALALWGSGIHEARILAGMVDDPKLVTERQAEEWVRGFDSWDVCDQVCMNLFDRTSFAYKKAAEWSGRREEFVRRAGFALMASLAVHDKKAPDKSFEAFLPLIVEAACDDRNFVRKAVNWALRQIGKRNAALNRKAAAAAKKLAESESKSARWVGADALRELESEAVRRRLKG